MLREHFGDFDWKHGSFQERLAKVNEQSQVGTAPIHLKSAKYMYNTLNIEQRPRLRRKENSNSSRILLLRRNKMNVLFFRLLNSFRVLRSSLRRYYPAEESSPEAGGIRVSKLDQELDGTLEVGGGAAGCI